MNKIHRIVTSIVVALLLFAPFSFVAQLPVYSSDSKWSPDASINLPISVIKKQQTYPKMVKSGNGSVIIVWEDYPQGKFYARKLAKNGSFLWDSAIEVGPTQYMSQHPQIVTDNENGLYVVWNEKREGGKDRIFVQRLSSDGSLLWGEGGLLVSNDESYESSSEPSAASDGTGGILISWTNSGSNMSVHAQHINKYGFSLWAYKGVRVSNKGLQRRFSKIIGNGQSGAIVLWNSLTEKKLKIQNIAGNEDLLWGASGKVITETSGSNGDHKDIVEDGSGGAIIVWEDVREGAQGLYAQRVNADGSALWGEGGIRLTSTIGKFKLVRNGAGDNYIVTTVESGDTDHDIFVQRFSDNGAVAGSLESGIAINKKEGYQILSDAINDDNSGLIILTSEFGIPGAPEQIDSDLYAYRIDREGNFLWGKHGLPVSTADKAQHGGSTIPSDGMIIAVWVDARNGNTDIYAQNFYIDGSLGEPCVLHYFGDVIRQDKGDWSNKPYGGIRKDGTFIPFKKYELKPESSHKDSIANWGCNLTSHAMIVNYYAKLQGVKASGNSDEVFHTDPDKLNRWLQENNGYATGAVLKDGNGDKYVTDSLVYASAVERYARKNGIALSYAYRGSYDSKKGKDGARAFTDEHGEELDAAMCELRPALLGVAFSGKNYPGHFVAATGKADNGNSWRIHDPLNSDPVTLDSSYGNIFWSLREAGTSVPKEYLHLTAHSPVGFVVTDPIGRKSGYNPLTDERFSDMPDAYYGPGGITSALGDIYIPSVDFEVKDPVDGQYTVEVYGTEEGEYSLELAFSEGDEIKKAPVVISETSKGQQDSYIIEYGSDDEERAKLSEKEQEAHKVEVGYRQLRRNYIISTRWAQMKAYIYGSGSFDVKDIDRTTVAAGPNNTEPLRRRKVYYRDYNRDGHEDLMLIFRVQNLGLEHGEHNLCMNGETNEGMRFSGCQDVHILSWGMYRDYLRSRRR